MLAAVLLGGAGNIGGAILGGFLVIYVPEWLRTVSEVFGMPERVNAFGLPLDISATSLRDFFFGVILIVMMIFRPQGMWPNRRRAAEYKDRAKEVSSVVADGARCSRSTTSRSASAAWSRSTRLTSHSTRARSSA